MQFYIIFMKYYLHLKSKQKENNEEKLTKIRKHEKHIFDYFSTRMGILLQSPLQTLPFFSSKGI